MQPGLDGSQGLSAAGRIGVDFGTNQVGPTDVDMYRFSLLSGGTVTIRLTPDLNNRDDFDTVLRLFNESGTQIAFNDDVGDDRYSTISIALTPGTYYAGVSGFGNSTYNPAGGGRQNGETGNYVIEFSLSNSDPNGLFSGAVEVDFGTDRTPTRFAGFIGADFGQPVGTADVDMFKVVAPDTGTLVVNIDTPFLNGFVDSYVRIFDEAGNEVAFSDDDLAPDEFIGFDGRVYRAGAGGGFIGNPTDSFVALSVERGQTYYVAVSDFANRTYNPTTLEGRLPTGPGGFYDILLRFVSVDSDGTITQATGNAPLFLPFGPIESSIGLDPSPAGGFQQVGDKDVDFYRIRVQRSSLVEIEVNASAENFPGNPFPFDTVLFLYDAQGRLLATNDDFIGLDPVLQFLAAPNTDYFIAVAGFGNASFDPFASGSGTPGETGTYRITGRLFSASSVKAVSDDAISHGRIQSVAAGDTIRGILGDDLGYVSGNADVDLYRFVAPANGVLSAITDGFDAFSANTVLRIFESSGREMAFNDDRDENTRGSLAAATVRAGKTYFIGVSGSSDNPRAYSPKKIGTAVPGSTGGYQLEVGFNASPTLTAVAPIALADAGLPFSLTHAALLAASNAADADGDDISFIVMRITKGVMTKDGQPVIAGVTTIGPGESLTWTPDARASGNVRAFTVLATDGAGRSLRAVPVTIAVNAAPTLTSVKLFRLAPNEAGDVIIPFDLMLKNANEKDRNRDAITFRIDSVFEGGTLSIDGVLVTPGQTLFSPGQSLVYRPTALGINTSAFTVRAFDGRLFSAGSPTVTVRAG
jgi:hypothetical protein